MWTLLSNETRALAPTWIVCVLTGSVAALSGGNAHRYSTFAFIAATASLGALSIGHEYGHHTLHLMLTLPISRIRLFLVKLTSLAAMVLPLVAGAWWLGLFAELPAIAWLLGAGPLCVAPALTMLCRSQLAGLIFSLSLPGAALIAVKIATGTSLAAPAPVAAWSRLMIVLLAGAAALEWWLFMRLESIDGGPAGIHVPWWTRTRRGRTASHPLWQLLGKEWQLQHMTFAVTALYVAACTTAAVFDVPGPDPNVSFIGAVTVVYALGLPALIGSLATAEERQLGTMTWQLQLPIPAWQQWTAKAVTTFGLSLVLSSGLPALLVAVFWPTEGAFVGMSLILPIATTAVSMYASSLCSSAVRAVVASVVAVPIALWLMVVLGGLRRHDALFDVLVAAVVLLLLRFAFLNHRPEPPAPARIGRQALSIAALVAVGLVIVRAAQF
jgi:ABC-type transport system involved in multi-copper enzyme maturation permease subunit